MKFLKLNIIILLSASPLLMADGDLDAYGVTVNDSTPDPGDTVTVRWTAINRSDGLWDTIGDSRQGVMFSTNSTISRSDTLLEKEYLGIMLPGQTSPETRVIRIPSSAVPGRDYWIGIYADYDRDRDEDDEGNNNSGGVKITIRQPDLYATDLSINDSNPDPGDFVTVSWRAWTRNDIPVEATQQAVVLSDDNRIDRGFTLLEREPLGRLGGIYFESTRELRTITIPRTLIPGQTYYLGVIMDYDKDINESSESNNDSVAGSFTVRGPDLRAEDLTGSTSLFGNESISINTWPGDSLNLEWIARNSGDGASLLFDFSQQAVRWSNDINVTRSDTILEKEPLGILTAGGDSPEARTVKIPSNVQIGNEYYLAIEADTDQEFTEYSEDNNFSNAIKVVIKAPVSSSSFDIMDYNYLPYLDGEGLERDDPRMRDNTGDGKPDPGVTMNSSRCFRPGDEAYVNLDVALDSDYTNLFNAKEDVEISAWYNTSKSATGWTAIGDMTLAVGSGGESFHLSWNLPHAVGDYYVFVRARIRMDGTWYTFEEKWIDEDNPVMVRDSLPVILVHGWSDTGGETFADLEMMIETLWERPVRAFGYETAQFVTPGSGNAPRVDQGYTDVFGESKPSLADQLQEFLDSPEGDGSEIDRCDIVAHSMGGLVSRNYILQEDKVRRLVTLGTPSYGGLFADTFLGDIALNNQAEDLETGSPVTWKIHREWKNRLETLPQFLAIVGTDDAALGKYNQSDILVTCSSASLENLGFPVYYVPLAHTDLLGKIGMAQVDGTNHLSWEPLEAFLNTETGVLPDSLPGHHGGVDDVGHKDHPDPLTSGALYVVNDQPIVSVTLGHTRRSFPIENSEVHEDGIFFANMLAADSSSEGSQQYTTAESRIYLGENESITRSLKVLAGETLVYAVNGNNNEVTEGDLDGDGLPNVIEELIIGANETDGLERHSDISPFGDYDGDGLPELLEVAMGTDPLTRDYRSLTTEIRDGFFCLRHRESHSDYGLSIVCQHASNLASPDWGSADLTSEIIASDDNGRTREWKVPVSGTTQFFRVSAEVAE